MSTAVRKRATVYVGGTPLALVNLAATHPEIPAHATIVEVDLEFEETRSIFDVAIGAPVDSRLAITLEWPA